MSDPGLDLAVQDAVRAALLSDGGVTGLIGDKVYDRPNPGALRPYIVVGDDDIADDSTTCSDASDILCTVTIHSDKPGKVEAKQIGGFVRRALDLEIDIAGHQVSVGHFETAVYRASQDGLTEGVLLFRYLVDPN